MSWQSLISGILGIWLIISGIIGVLARPLNLIIVGIIIAILGFWGAFRK